MKIETRAFGHASPPVGSIQGTSVRVRRGESDAGTLWAEVSLGATKAVIADPGLLRELGRALVNLGIEIEAAR